MSVLDKLYRWFWKSFSSSLILVRTLIYFEGATDCGWELETHRPLYQRNCAFHLWILSLGDLKSRKIPQDFLGYFSLSQVFATIFVQNHPPSWGFLYQERHLSTRVLTHQRVGKNSTGGSGSHKATTEPTPNSLLCNRKKWLMGFVKWRKVNDFTITFVVVESKDVVWIFFRNGQRPHTHLEMWVGKISRVWCQHQIVPIA